LIIIFNLTGWMFPVTRRLHLVVIGLTAASWFILGLWFGLGYCPITDWQWRVKEELGEVDLPASFITYAARRVTGISFPDSLVNTITLAGFLLAAALSLYVNIFRKRKGYSTGTK